MFAHEQGVPSVLNYWQSAVTCVQCHCIQMIHIMASAQQPSNHVWQSDLVMLAGWEESSSQHECTNSTCLHTVLISAHPTRATLTQTAVLSYTPIHSNPGSVCDLPTPEKEKWRVSHLKSHMSSDLMARWVGTTYAKYYTHGESYLF
jgi:hypothetical protein